MGSTYICATIFFDASAESLIELYEAAADPPAGYLVRVNDLWVMTDIAATESADWGRQTQIAMQMTADGAVALSLFLVGDNWGMALSHDEKLGPVAVYDPDEVKVMQGLPESLMRLESLFADLFPDMVDAEELDALFGAMLEGAVSPEDGFAQITEMLGVPGNWLRWSWSETIPEQLFIDPDLAERVLPLGAAKEFWEN